MSIVNPHPVGCVLLDKRQDVYWVLTVNGWMSLDSAHRRVFETIPGYDDSDFQRVIPRETDPRYPTQGHENRDSVAKQPAQEPVEVCECARDENDDGHISWDEFRGIKIRPLRRDPMRRPIEVGQVWAVDGTSLLWFVISPNRVIALFAGGDDHTPNSLINTYGDGLWLQQEATVYAATR